MGVLKDAMENASRATRRVVVCLDGAGASKRDALYARLKATQPSDGRVSKSPVKAIRDDIAALEESLASSLVTFELTSLTPDRWSKIKRECPPDLTDHVARAHGFNVNVAVQKALLEPGAAMVVAGEDEREAVSKEEWQDLFTHPVKALGGGDWDRFVLAVLELNQASSSEAIARGKA